MFFRNLIFERRADISIVYNSDIHVRKDMFFVRIEVREFGEKIVTLAIILGIVFGAVAIVPLWASTFFIKRIPATKITALLLTFIFAILVSLAILIAALLIYNGSAHDTVIPFAIAEVGAFFAGIAVFAVVRLLRK